MVLMVEVAVVAFAAVAQGEVYDGRSTEDTVRVVVGGLAAIAVATAVLMVVYLWHTSPRRRQRIATGRAERDVVPPPESDA